MTTLQRREPATALIRDAEALLERAATPAEAKQIVDQAEVLHLYAQRVGESHELQNSLAEVKLRAARKAGEMLAEGGRGSRPDSISAPRAAQWRRLARIAPEEFDAAIAAIRDTDDELTLARLLPLAPKAYAASSVLNAYPPELRQAARELEAEGLTYAQIGERLGVSRTSVRNWLDPKVAAKRQEREGDRRRKREDAKVEARVARLPKDGLGEAWSLIRRVARSLDAAINAAPTAEDRRTRERALHAVYAAEDDIKAAILRSPGGGK